MEKRIKNEPEDYTGINNQCPEKPSTSNSNPSANPTARNFDEQSARGRFGWAVIMTHDIPYIFRSDEKYCCFRMLEQKVLNKFFFYFHKELISCTNIKYVTISKTEAGLLNEINSNHCNFQFGKERFTSEDVLLKLSDAVKLCQFLHCCYAKLETIKDFDVQKYCGFIRISNDSVVPYSVMNKQRCVPLFYFEGETEELKQYTKKMEGWDLAYLKFCCKIQGIRNDLFNGFCCLVVSLNDLKMFFPPNTVFEEYWPTRIEPRQKDQSQSFSLNSIFDMAVNSVTATGINQPNAVTQKRFAVQSKIINIRNDPAAPNCTTASKISPEYSIINTYSVYKLQHVVIENKIIICINMKPNDMTDKWVPVMDLSNDFFYRIPVRICEQVLDVLGIEIYKANTAQMRILRTTGRYNTNEVLSLVQVEKVIQFLPQLTYMIRNILTKSQQVRAQQRH